MDIEESVAVTLAFLALLFALALPTWQSSDEEAGLLNELSLEPRFAPAGTALTLPGKSGSPAAF